jgi:hypothetical protein
MHHQPRFARTFFPVLFACLLLAWSPAPAQAAPVPSVEGVWQWMSEVWTGLLPGAGAVRSPRRPARAPHGQKAGGCVDPDGLAATACSNAEASPETPLTTNG